MDSIETGLTERMIVRKDGPIGWMIFNNPARRNAVSMDMWQAVPRIMDAFEADPAIRTIVLAGAGDKAFVSGADISEFAERRSTAEHVAAYEKHTEEASRRLQNTDKPTIAMIRGFCVGGGVAVALSCDLRICSDNARFSVPASKLGLGYKAPGIKKLMEVVGPAFAKEIFYTARLFDAGEAKEMGLVNRVVPDAVLEAYVRNYCTMIGGNAPLTNRAVKRTVKELQKSPEAVDYAACDALVKECFDSADYVEGRTAFMEKRKPVFTGA